MKTNRKDTALSGQVNSAIPNGRADAADAAASAPAPNPFSPYLGPATAEDMATAQSALSPDVLSRIRAEEIFRSAVQRSLSADDPSASWPRRQWNKFVRFGNTSLGVWLLSSVVLASVTGTYSAWDQRRKDSSASAERQRKLTVELKSRIMRYKMAPNKPSSVDELQRGSVGVVFPENKDRGLTALVFELKESVAKPASAEMGSLEGSIEKFLILEQDATPSTAQWAEFNTNLDGLLGVLPAPAP